MIVLRGIIVLVVWSFYGISYWLCS